MATNDSENIVLYGVGLIALALSVTLFAFAFYIMPYMLFNFVYDVPTFIILVVYWYQTVYGLSGMSLVLTVLLPWLISATFMGFVARRLTRRIESVGQLKRLVIQSDLKGNFWKYLQPAMYEVILIIFVLVLLFLAEGMIVLQYD